MNLYAVVPEVSLITSWHVPTGETDSDAPALEAIRQPLQEGVRVLDLYFLNHGDIPCYARMANLPDTQYSKEPHAFVANLKVEHLEDIANNLLLMLTEYYGGHLVGRRPRFAALATFFPDISLPPGTGEDPGGRLREQAVRALRNTLYLARRLGCRCVEIVGGAGVPGYRYQRQNNRTISPEEYRALRRKSLARSLCEVYELQHPENPLREMKENPETVPVVALELEPGTSFLLNDISEFELLSGSIEKLAGHGGQTTALRCTKLNIDIAHAFLIGLEADRVEKQFADRIAHMHISDHAGDHSVGGTHASDLAPGLFHFFEDYREWLEFAMRLRQSSPGYSGFVAVEMEACNDLVMVLDAMHTTRRWLREIARPASNRVDSPTSLPGDSDLMPEGALLVVDVGHSTKNLLRADGESSKVQAVEKKLADLCGIVSHAGGSVMSFTGDGFIALFEQEHYLKHGAGAETALGAARKVIHAIAPEKGGPLTARAALHWGTAYIPPSGPLAGEIIGLDVVLATRLCDWAKGVERGKPRPKRGGEIFMTPHFWDCLPDEKRKTIKTEDWPDELLKDFEDQPLFIRQYLSENEGQNG